MIIVAHEACEEGIAIGVRGEQAMGDAALWLSPDGLADASVEALDDAVGLRTERLGQAMLDANFRTSLVEGMVAGGFVFGLSRHIDGEAVGELGTHRERLSLSALSLCESRLR
jgi:hypothetical protein